MRATYWVVQHVADLFRNEPRNVGVIVSFDNKFMARFFGEDGNKPIDGRKLKKLPYPSVYKQWIQYWRRTMPDIETIVAQTSNNYRVSVGGELTDVRGESISEVADFLYSVLVSEGAIAEALQDRAAEQVPSMRLEAEVEQSLLELDVIEIADNDLFVSHPVLRSAVIQGKVANHTPAFSQMNGKLYVIESADLTMTRRKLVKDHAGWAAYMFRDIRDRRDGGIEAISIVRATDEDKNTAEGDFALKVLHNESYVVDWLSDAARNDFLRQRRHIAFA